MASVLLGRHDMKPNANPLVLLPLTLLAVLPALLVAQAPTPAPTELPAVATTQLQRSLAESEKHSSHVWRDTPAVNEDGTVNAYVEIARGDHRKWEFAMGSNARAIDRVMPPEIGPYPVNYGFVPQTVSYDGDPFDALVLGPPIPGGHLVRGVIVGLMAMEDEKGWDAKVVLSVAGPQSGSPLRLTEADQQEIGSYFRRYKQGEPGKFSRVPGWGSIADGRAHVETTHAFFLQCRQLSGAACRLAQSAAQAAPPRADAVEPADRAAARLDANSMTAHKQLLEKARAGGIDVYFLGDSITRRWGATDYPALLANWRENFFGWNAGNFGWGGDRTQNILWRLEHGELDGVHPRVIVIQAGTNNVGAQPGGPAKVDDIGRGLKAIVDLCRQKAPRATIILTAIFPRNDNMAVMPEIDQVNTRLEALANGRDIRYLNVNAKLADTDGRLFEGMMHERDALHPTLRGYQVWADALKPVLTELLGPPARTDHAPPPTGDPSARP